MFLNLLLFLSLYIDFTTKVFSSFSERNINFVEQLFKTDGAVKPWKQLKEGYGLANKLKFKWIQLIYSLPKPWIEQIFMDSENSINLAIQDHDLIKKDQILCLNKLDSKELYNIQLLINFLKPVSQAYFENVFTDMFLNGTRSISYLEFY